MDYAQIHWLNCINCEKKNNDRNNGHIVCCNSFETIIKGCDEEINSLVFISIFGKFINMKTSKENVCRLDGHILEYFLSVKILK